MLYSSRKVPGTSTFTSWPVPKRELSEELLLLKEKLLLPSLLLQPQLLLPLLLDPQLLQPDLLLSLLLDPELLKPDLLLPLLLNPQLLKPELLGKSSCLGLLGAEGFGDEGHNPWLEDVQDLGHQGRLGGGRRR